MFGCFDPIRAVHRRASTRWLVIFGVGFLLVGPVHAETNLFLAHPRLLLDAPGVMQLRQRIATSPWAKIEWSSLETEARKSLGSAVTLPPRGGNWSHNYVCPTHGARLSQGKQIGAWQWEHRCPVGNHRLLGDPTKAALDFDGNAIAGLHGRWACESVDQGLVFQVTGNSQHVARAREILLAYAARYRTYPLHDNQGRTGSGGRVASQALTEASWLIEMAQGADLVWDTFSATEQEGLRAKLFQPALDEVLFKRAPSIHNIQCRINSAVGLVGYLFGDARLIARAIDDPKAGYCQQLAKGVLADGMWHEGSSGYHFFTIEGLWPLAEAARHCGRDLYGPKLQSMFDAPLELAMPDFSLPDFNDSGVVALSEQRRLYELAYARYHRPEYVPLLLGGERQGRMALLFGEAELAAAESKVLASHNSPASGYAIFRRGTAASAVWLGLKYGPHGGGHGHPDKNHFLLFARGQVLAPDGGTHAYGAALHKQWDQTTVAHNTLVVNQTNQLPTQGRSLAFGAEAGVEYSITDAGDIYSGVRFVRTVAMLTPDLIVFVDQVHSAQPATLDLSYHQFGVWTNLPAGQRWSPPPLPGYRYLKDATTRMLELGGKVLETSVRQDWQPTLVLAGGETTELITGYGPLKTTEQRVPWLLQRRRASATAFVWAIALDGAPVRLTVSDLRDPSGRRLDHADALGIAAQSGGRLWKLRVNPQARELEVGADNVRSRAALFHAEVTAAAEGTK